MPGLAHRVDEPTVVPLGEVNHLSITRDLALLERLIGGHGTHVDRTPVPRAWHRSAEERSQHADAVEPLMRKDGAVHIRPLPTRQVAAELTRQLDDCLMQRHRHRVITSLTRGLARIAAAAPGGTGPRSERY